MEIGYVIFNISELSSINFTEVLETSIDSVRKSIDGQKTFVKWEGDIPNCVNSLTTKQGIFTNNQMIEILKTKEWTKSIFN